MELYLVRHGQSEGNIGKTDQPDPPLTKLGWQQAEWVAERLVAEDIDIIYTSPMRRALQTAQVLCSYLGDRAQAWTDICETSDWQEYRGLPRSEIELSFPGMDLPSGITEQGWWRLDGENESTAYGRAARVEAHLRTMHECSTRRIVLVGHGTFGAILIGQLLGLGASGYTRFSQHNACVSQFEILPGRIKLRYLNRIEHLPEHAIT